ncbi:hypothetical protein GALL_465490 [mine drainage metagenome]|uniref:Uncharacterized protein n=1 Tax=mine drainage metagenome TaxID=410659 RepID=A0A1J5PJY8_9ZZZZ
MKFLAEYCVGSKECFHAHRGGDVCECAEFFKIGDRHQQHAEHAIGTVDESEAFFLRQHYWLDALVLQVRKRIVHNSGAIHREAFTHENQCAMREWC